MFEKYSTQSLFRQVTTGELQAEVKQIKCQIKELQMTINQQELNQFHMDARIAIMENNYNKPYSINNTEPSTSNKNTSLDKQKGIIISEPEQDET